MSKYNDKYKKEHYVQVIINLKPNEKILLDSVLNTLKISRRKLLLKMIDKIKERFYVKNKIDI